MRVTYMISLNHDLKLKSSTILHAYKIATNPRKPAQILTTPPYPSRKFGLRHRQTKGAANGHAQPKATAPHSYSTDCGLPITDPSGSQVWDSNHSPEEPCFRQVQGGGNHGA